MNKTIKEVLKSEKLSWGKLAIIVGGGNRSSLKVKVEGWAAKLNHTFNAIGYEVIFRKISNGSKENQNDTQNGVS